MKMLSLIPVGTFMALLLSSPLAISGEHEDAQKMNGSTEQGVDNAVVAEENVVDIAVKDENFSTLVKALKAADLVDTLKSATSVTIFAPTNEAFDKLPEGTLDDLLKPENKDKLAKILKFHVVSKVIKSEDILPGSTMVTTLDGKTFTVKKEGGVVMVNDGTVSKADVVGSNGVIHVIDVVLLPPEE